jgi:hypothetical protein
MVRRALEGDVVDSPPTNTGASPSPVPAEFGSSARTWPMLTQGVDSSGLHDLADWIMEQIHERIEREFERRGGRYRGGF